MTDPIATLDLVPPLVVRLTALLVFTLSGFMIAVHTLIVAGSAHRAELAPSTKVRAPFFVAAALAMWLAVALTIADGVHFPLPSDTVRRILTLAALLVPIVLGVASLFSSRALRAINAATPSHWLIWPQVSRLAGGIFLFPFLYYAVLPGAFAWPAGIGDMLTGAAAPFVAAAFARGTPRARTWAILWNLFGILDLIVAQVTALRTGAAVAIVYPLALVPLFLGPPLATLLHVFSLRNLWVTRAASRVVRTGELAAA
jgi:hypothetical protein